MFCIHAHLLPSVSSYDEARRVYDHATKFSPTTSVAYKLPSNIRGLRNKQDTSKTVFVDSDGAVNFQYHHHVMVKWVSPTEVHVLCYDTRSSVEFANAFLPTGLRASGTTMRVNGYRAMNGYLVFRKHDNCWEVDPATADAEFQLALDRKTAAQVRKVFTPFLEWRKSLNALRQTREPGFGGVGFSYTARQLANIVFGMGHIPEEEYQVFYKCIGPINDQTMLNLYAACGAVYKKQLPLGVPPRKTKYDHLAYHAPYEARQTV